MGQHFEGETARQQSSRNYRPEYPPGHLRRHSAFYPDSAQFPAVYEILKVAGALHRAAFLGAAHVTRGLFLDLHQIPHELPVPNDDMLWCAILNDDEPMRGGSRGPSFFHTQSLAALFSKADVICLNAAGVDAQSYAVASAVLANNGKRVILVETTDDMLIPWRSYAQKQRREAVVGIMASTPYFDITKGAYVDVS